MKPVIKTQEINGRQVKSIQKWQYVYFVQFYSGRPTFISFKNLDCQEPQTYDDLDTIKIFLETQLPTYTINCVQEDCVVKIGASSRQTMPGNIVFRLKDSDVRNVASAIKENKDDAGRIYEKFSMKFKVFSI